MMAVKSIYHNSATFSEFKTPLYNLMPGEIRISILNLSDEMGNAHG